ncbi:MAG: family 78 glycoside hydrolase catalytic domain, partial [Aristaeellaceae bacterium]
MAYLIQLRTENRMNPINVDTGRPVFSWRVEQAAPNWMQDSCRLLVWQGDTLMWDSGELGTSRMNQMEYNGAPLAAETAYRWQVCVTAHSDAGRESITSSDAHFVTAMLTPGDWKGQWVGETQDEHYHLFRRAFQVDRPLRSARLSLCALGHGVCMVNGQPVTDAVLEPGWTDYRKTCLYTTYDVTALLRTGDNALCVKLGDGMYNVRGGRYVYFPRSYGQRKLLMQLCLDYADGTRAYVLSDGAWRMGESPVRFSCIYGGEDADGRIPFAEASLPDFDDSAWQAAPLVPAPAAVLRAQAIPPEKVMQRYTPVKVTRLPDGRDLYDLGKNFSGWVRIRLRTNGQMAGQKVVMTPGEILGADGLPDQRVTGKGYAWTYFLNGDETQEFAPDFTYTGFRYVAVEGAAPAGSPLADKPVLESLTGEFIYPDMEETGSFDCSDPLFNSIHAIIRQAMLSNIKSYFTDCPHREKLPWLEETHLIGPAMLCSWDLQALYEKVEQDMADAQRDSGLVADICPEYVTGFDKWHKGFVDSPEWGSA